MRRLPALRLPDRGHKRPSGPSPEEVPVVQAIFDRYARGRLGLKVIANALNEAGLRTKAGRPWNHMAVLTVIRNRAYWGGDLLPQRLPRRPPSGPRRRRDLRAGPGILARRGEDHAHRASNASDCLLAGLVTCAHCGKRFVGTAATGNRYRYYTCFSRQRYGPAACSAERLPADQLEEAILDAVVETYGRTDLFEVAAAQAAQRFGSMRDRRVAKLAAVEAELSRTEDAIERYLLAFEAGSLPESQCGHRIRALGARAADLRTSQAELAASSRPTPPRRS